MGRKKVLLAIKGRRQTFPEKEKERRKKERIWKYGEG